MPFDLINYLTLKLRNDHAFKRKFLLLILIFSSSLFAVMEGGVSLTRFTPTERYANHLEPSLGFELYGLFEPPMSYFGIGGYFTNIFLMIPEAFRVHLVKRFK